MKSLARLVLIVSLMVSIGGHWGVLQAIAWARMITDYSAEKGLVGGIVETFNGERPCEMCLKIKAAKDKEQKEHAPAQTEKSDALSKWAGASASSLFTVPRRVDACTGLPATLPPALAAQWQSAPPSPPPRCGSPA